MHSLASRSLCCGTLPFVYGRWHLLIVLIALSLNLPGANTPARDLSGHAMNPLASSESGVVILIFMATDCPISNRYAPAVNDLVRTFSSPTLRFFSVYPDSATTSSSIRKHREEYGYTLPALLDPGHELVRKAGVTVTPEVAVFLLPTQSGTSPRLIYRGRIDNRHENIGRIRPEATLHDLSDVLTAITQGTPAAFRTTRAVGCYIE